MKNPTSEKRKHRLSIPKKGSISANETKRKISVGSVFGALVRLLPTPAEKRRMEDSSSVGSYFVPRVRERNFALSVIFTVMKLSFFALLIIGVTGIGAVVGIVRGYMNTSPDLDISQIENQSQTSFIYDCNGDLITTFAGLENRTNATYDELPQYLIDAIVSIEDERFFYHNGIDLKRIAGAFLSNLTSSSTQGGSTITQQLIKMRVLSPEQTYKRKLQEAYLAMQLEKEYEKEDILTAYLNTIDLGSGNYGVKAAAKDYFGKDLNELTLRECAMLAGVANSASLYNPRSNYYTKNRPERTNERTDLVLRNMYKNDKITLEEYEAALQEVVYINPVSEARSLYDMPYFVEYAITDVITHLLRQRGLEENDENRGDLENELRSSGYSIYLTVDPDIQHEVEESLYTWNKYPMTASESDSQIVYTNADGTQYTVPQPQAAACVLDFGTGAIKAIVGGRQAPTAAKTLNRASSSHMPVGSAIKPIAVYGPALDLGASPSTVILNMPVPIEGWNSATGFPSGTSAANYGMTTIRTGIIRSLNIVAARTLLEHVGIPQSVQYLRNLGVQSEINENPAGLALGTSGITVIEMTGAYGAIANGGRYIEPVSFTKVVDSQGNTILNADNTQETRQVFDKSTAWLLTDMLTDAVQSGTGTAARINGITVAGKTGTNNDSRGVFFAGFTGYYAASIWIGQDNYKPLYSGSSGGVDAAPLWQNFMAKIHSGWENKSIQDESASQLGLEQITTCSVSGLLATDLCALDSEGNVPVIDWADPSHAVTETCHLHQEAFFCKVSGALCTSYCPQPLRESKSVVKLPEDSPLRRIAEDILFKYLPNGVLTWPEEPATDEELLHQPLALPGVYTYCTVHTKAWAQEQEQVALVRSKAQSVLTEANAMISQYGSILNTTWLNQLKSQVNTLTPYMAEDSYPALADITSAYNNLKGTVDSLHSVLAPLG